MPDILILPQRGTSNNPTMHFTGSGANNVRMEVLPSGSVAFIGTSGSLFNITDNLLGSLMAVGDVSGLPILEVFSDDRVVMGKYNKNTLYVSGTNVGVGKVPLNAVLDVSGSAAITGSLSVTGSVGIGIAATGTPLHVRGQSGGGDTTLKLQEYGSNTWTFHSGGRFSINNNAGTSIFSIGDSATPDGYLNISSAGNVGVGTTTPSYKLDVSGTLAASGRVTFSNGGTGGSGTLTVAGDITTYRGASVGVLYLGSDQNHYLYFDGSNYYLPSGQLYVNSTQVVLNSGTWSINVSGTAASETFSTVTGRGATTSTQISVGSGNAGAMYTGTKVGSGYSDGVSGATFKAIIDNSNGGSGFAFASYYGGSGGTLGASIRADGYSYFSNGVGIGTSTPSYKLDVFQNSNDTIIRSISSTAGAWFYADSAADGYFGIDLRQNGTSKWFIGQNNGGTTLSIRRSGSEVMTILASGYVGIGTTSPNATLAVNGNTTITGSLNVSSAIYGDYDLSPIFMMMGG